MQPKVSIIVPIYGVEKYLNRCIESLMKQTLKEIEIIMVDDESPDNCPVLCEKYKKIDSRIKVIHKKNGGLGLARNSGLEIAEGEYVAFVDSDDYVSCDMYQRLYETAKKESADTVIAGFNKIDYMGNKREIVETQNIAVYNGKFQLHEYVIGMLGSPASCKKVQLREMSVWRGIYSHKVIKENQLRFYSERQFISEDIIFHLDYFEKAEKLIILPETFYNYCYNEQSLTTIYREDRYYKNCELYIEICRKLELYGYDNIAFEYAKKLFLIRSRGCILSIIANRRNLGLKKIKQQIKKIQEDDLFVNIVHSYPIIHMPLKKQLLMWALRWKFTYIVILMAIIRGK